MFRRRMTLSAARRPRILLALAGLFLVVLLVALACGEEATPTPVPAATATPRPAATATPVPQPTAVPPTAVPEVKIRPKSQWTVDKPATREEIEAELEKYRGKQLVFASWGGAYQNAQRQAYFLPFSEQFGIEIVEDSGMNYGKARAMAETGNIDWHVTDWGGQAGWQHADTGVMEELDFSIIDTRDFLEAGVSPYFGGGGVTWSNVIAYNTDSVNDKWGGNTPTTMADMFDVESFPGRRALAAPEWSWKTSLRFALLSRHPEYLETQASRAALGAVLSDDLIAEAYGILDEIKPYINVWWTTGSDCPSLLISRELDICTAWNGRIYDAAKAGNPIDICWTCGHMLQTDDWAIIKGLKASNPETFELAQLFMAWTSFPEINVEVSKYISYGPMNVKAIPLLEAPEFADVKNHLPTSGRNIAYGFAQDERGDGKVAGAMAQQWLEWQQK